MQSVTSGNIKGVLLRMGNSVRDLDIKADRLRAQDQYDRFQADREVALAFQSHRSSRYLGNEFRHYRPAWLRDRRRGAHYLCAEELPAAF